MAIIKPMLASDADPQRIQYPVLVQPKIDGVRGLVQDGVLVGRSLKPIPNKYTQALFGIELLEGMDGELAAGEETDADLCRKSTSALMSFEGEPRVVFHLFDYVDPSQDLPYVMRLDYVRARAHHLLSRPDNQLLIKPVVSWYVHNEDELDKAHSYFIQCGYEGLIIRDPAGLHKRGRSTISEGGLLRVKQYETAEGRVTKILEGKRNENEAFINELGRTDRSKRRANMIPNGMVGSIIVEDLKNGGTITVSPGKLSHTERIYYFNNPHKIINQIITYKHFNHGVKDKPRHATFQNFRNQIDMSE